MQYYYAHTKYDDKKEPIRTDLYKHDGTFLFAIAGWYNVDDMVRMYYARRKNNGSIKV